MLLEMLQIETVIPPRIDVDLERIGPLPHCELPDLAFGSSRDLSDQTRHLARRLFG